MASKKNDDLSVFTPDGWLNYYADQKVCGTATERGLSTRLGGHSYNVLTGSSRDERYFMNMRHDQHFVDDKGNHTQHWFGARRKKSSNMDSSHLRPLPQREATDSFVRAPRRFSSSQRLYEVETLRPCLVPKDDFHRRRGETMQKSFTAPNNLRAPAETPPVDVPRLPSKPQTAGAGGGAPAGQRPTPKAKHTAPCGLTRDEPHVHCSISRVANHDFAVTRKNNHYSGQDKLTRSDPFYTKPPVGTRNSSVKYDILSNEIKWFMY